MNFFIWKYETHFGEENAVIVITEEGNTLGIPEDEGNRDYQAYLAWLAEGNTPEPWNPEGEN